MVTYVEEAGIKSIVVGGAGKGYNVVVDGQGRNVKRVGPANWRNHNPGNLEYGEFAKANGAIGTDGRFAIFPNYETGRKAKEKLLFEGKRYQGKTIAEAINIYAPPSENNTTAYINSVSKAVGVPSNTPMRNLTPAQRVAMLDAMQKVEGYKVGKIILQDGTGEAVQSVPVPPPKPTKPNQEPPPESGPLPNIGDNYLTLPGQEGQFRYQAEQGVLDTSQPLDNILHDYPSYTYSLSLHLLNPEEYNAVVLGGQYIPKRVLVAGAGRHNETTFVRSPYFSEDFYFDELNIDTVIGVNAMSRNTNAIQFSFEIIEPYGLTLINRLLDQANDPEMLCSNYLDMIYLLQVDFYASNDQGQVVGAIPGTTKRFPIKIIQMDIKAGTNGGEYKIQAVPYNHTAYEQTFISVPVNMEIKAGSVGEFFQAGQAVNPQSQITSLPKGLNGWQQDLVKNKKISVPDSYTFDIDPAIAQSAFSSANQLASRDTAMADLKNTLSVRKSNLGDATSSFDAQTRTFGINAGTSIDKVVDYVVRNSDYIKNQVTIPDGMSPETYLQEKSKNANMPLNWYKIVPTVTLGEYDPIRKIYAKNVTYSVQPYTMYNVKSDVAPQGKIDKFVKVYNYIYTGKNNDVIDFDINFNTLYYTAQTAYRGALTTLYKNQASGVRASGDANADTYQGTDQKPNSVMPVVTKPQVYNAKSRATGGSVDPKTVAVADLEDSLMTLSAADMLNVQLKIVGDPQFLKQDDCFYSPLTEFTSDDPRLTKNNSIRTDYGEVYVQLYFRTPVDINETNSLYNFGQNYRTSVFSGIYKVLTVKSNFAKGVFTQTLDLIRLPYQPNYDYVGQSQTTNNERSSDITQQSIVSQTQQSIPIPTPAESLSKTLESEGLASAQATLSRNLTQISALTKDQSALKNILNNVTPKAITRSNEPPTVPPIRNT